jgi:uncharacterized membrane protein
MEGAHGITLESAVHLIQVALTPVFLLSGIAALLNVFASRLARVADQLEKIGGLMEGACDETRAQANQDVARLHRRSLVLDVAVVLGTLGAAATCLAIMALFLLALSNKAIADALLFMFAGAVLCTLGSVVAFGVEMLMSNNALRKRMHFHVPDLRHVFRARGAN